MGIPLCLLFTSKRRANGFTLIEAMVSVSLLAILAGLALPAFRQISERLAVSTVSDEMVAAINLTRNSAIQFNGNVVIRKLTEAETGLPAGTCNTTQNWSCGWQVFRDLDNDQNLVNGEPILYTFAITNNVVVMRSVNGALMSANRWGQLNGVNAVGFAVSPKGNGALTASTVVCMNSGGRIRTVKESVVCPP